MSTESFSYLWDGTEDGWVLVRVNKGRLPAIYNRVTHMALIVEEEDEYACVVQQMIDHGKEVLEELP